MDYSTELQGKTALVTGATRGIGRAIALELAARGAVVVGTATSESGAAAITEALAPFGGRGVVLDVTNAEACDALIDALGKESGGPHILVNNAGITRDTLAMRMKDDDWSAVIDTNLASVFRLSRGVLRNMMKARWGRIINVTSVVGLSGNPGQANYAAAKAGVAGMARAGARAGQPQHHRELRGAGFHRYRHDARAGRNPDGGAAAADSAGPPGRACRHRARGRILSGPQAGYITGTTLHVNGGMYMQ